MATAGCAPAASAGMGSVGVPTPMCFSSPASPSRYHPVQAGSTDCVERINRVAETIKSRTEGALAHLYLAVFQLKQGKQQEAIQHLRCARAFGYEPAQIDLLLESLVLTAEAWTNPARLLEKLLPLKSKEAIEFIKGPSPNPEDEGKSVGETHYIGFRFNIISIKGVLAPFNVNNLDKLDRASGGKGFAQCPFLWELSSPTNIINTPIKIEFELLVMTKKVLPGTRNQSYEVQEIVAKSLGYEIPKFLDAASCIMGNCSSEVPLRDETFTSVSDRRGLVIGVLPSSTGLEAYFFYGQRHIHGAMGIRRF